MGPLGPGVAFRFSHLCPMLEECCIRCKFFKPSRKVCSHLLSDENLHSLLVHMARGQVSWLGGDTRCQSQ